MTDKEILEKAIEKAIANGWEFDNYDKWQWHAVKKTDTVMNDWYYFSLFYDGERRIIDAYRIIFHSDFAKSLWGEHTETMTVQNNTLNVKQVIDMDGWRYYLQQMVIAGDPIKYLGKHIDD